MNQICVLHQTVEQITIARQCFLTFSFKETLYKQKIGQRKGGRSGSSGSLLTQRPGGPQPEFHILHFFLLQLQLRRINYYGEIDCA